MKDEKKQQDLFSYFSHFKIRTNTLQLDSLLLIIIQNRGKKNKVFTNVKKKRERDTFVVSHKVNERTNERYLHAKDTFFSMTRKYYRSKDDSQLFSLQDSSADRITHLNEDTRFSSSKLFVYPSYKILLLLVLHCISI